MLKDPEKKRQAKSGKMLYEAGDYSDACRVYQNFIETNPNDGNYEGWLKCLDMLDEATRRKAVDDVEKAIGKKPEYSEAYINWGNALYAQNKHAEAIERYRKAIEVKPDHVDAYIYWGDSLFEQKKYPEAIEQYRRATELKPEAGAYNNWGSALAALKKYPDAIEQYRKAIDIQPDYAFAYNNWGAALQAERKNAEAIEKYSEAIRFNPEYADAYFNWGNALRAQKNYPEAIEQYRKALTFKPEHAGAYLNLGNTFCDQKQYSEAIEQYRKAIEHDNPTAYLNWANALGDQHRYQEAIAVLRKATAVNPTDPDAYHNIAYYLSRQGKYGASWEAWTDVRRTYQQAREQEKFRSDADYFANYGSVLYEIFADYEEAEQNYKRALELDANHSGVLSSLVNFYLEKADEEIDQSKDWFALKDSIDTDRRATAHADAWDAFVRAEETLKEQSKDPASSSGLLQLGELYLSMKQYPAAAEYLRKAFEANPTSPTPCTDLGILCMRKELFRDAVQYFEDARQRDPHDFAIRSNLAGAYAKLNLTDKAEAEYNRILEVTKNHVESLTGLGELYTQIGDSGDTDMFDLAISYFTQAIQIGQSKKGSKRLKKKELAAVHYSRGYSRVKLYEAVKLAKDEALLYAAMADFRSALQYDSEHHKARRAKEKIEKRTRRFSPQRLAEQWGPLSIFVLSLAVFVFTQRRFVFIAPDDLSLHSGYYATLTFGALIFMVAGLYLPQILKLKVAGIQLEKSSADQIATPSALGISK